MNIFFIGGTLTISLLVAPFARSADIPCDGCSYAQMFSRAQSQGKGTHRIYSYSTGNIYRFSVTCPGNIPEGTGGTTNSKSLPDQDTNTLDTTESVQSACAFNKPVEVEEIPLDAAMADAWPKILEFIQYRNANYPGSLYDFEIDSREDRQNYVNDKTVYGVIGDYPARTALFTDISRYYSPIQKFIAAVSSAARAHFTNFSNTILIKFTFKDGTSIVIKFDYTTQQFEFVKNSARQPNGTTPMVEANTSEYAGNYPYGGGDGGAYARYLRDSGVNVVEGGGLVTMSCSWTGETLTCKIPKMNN